MPARWLRFLLAAPLLASGTAAGCSLVDRGCVAPVSGSISYYGSSVPPPFHVEWTITLDGDGGRFEVTPGYGSAQRWAADFRPDPTLVAAVCTRVVEAPEEQNPPPGSAVITADLRDGSDRSVRKRAVATGSGGLYTAVKAAVPETTWTTVYGEYERWSDQQ
ncbi:MAG TPA: hypothetical protein VM428_03530 [Microlunatus sp.]|nr:hypothetical protein [Microlunatus sp.]